MAKETHAGQNAQMQRSGSREEIAEAGAPEDRAGSAAWVGLIEVGPGHP